MTPCTSCPACDADVKAWRSTRDFVFEQTFELVRCTSCGLVTVDPRPGDEDLARYYADGFYGEPSSTSGAALRFFYQRREATVRRHHRDVRRILDVGCGDGGFLAYMAQQGVVVTGFEPSAAGAARARARVTNQSRGTGAVFERLDDVAGAFDVVTAWHVLEHVAAPRPFLARLRELLAPGGVVVLAVPNIDSLEARIGGDAWFHLDVPRHLHHFSASSLRTLVERSGFDVVSVEGFSIEYGPFGLLQTAMNLLPIERNALYQFAKHGRPLKSFPWLTSAALLGAAALAPAAVVGSVLEAVVGRGSSITITARRR